MTGIIPKGTPVLVTPESPSGKPWPPYRSTVLDVRTGVKGLGSVEYLVSLGSTGGGMRWAADRFVKKIEEHKE